MATTPDRRSPAPPRGHASDSLERFLRAARDAGCPRDQVANFRRANLVLQPRQLAASAAARQCDRPGGPTEVGYGGARGGGKSHWMLGQLGADDAQRLPGFKGLLLRKVGKAGRESFEDLLPRVLGGLPHEYVSTKGQLHFPNGSRLLLGHYKDERDVDAYLGLEYDAIGIEEATTLTASKVRTIRTCCRTSKPGWRPRTYYTTNPGGVGHSWFRERFIKPARGDDGGSGPTRFIPATADDNGFLNPEYVAVLDGLTGWQKRAWRYGDWDIAAGQFFTTWRFDAHVAETPPIPAGWKVWLALDYGFTHYTACYLFAQSGDGHVYAVDEHAERGWLVERHAAAIKAMLARHGIGPNRLEKAVAGADVFAKKQNGGTVADDYKAHGLKLAAANDDRQNGAAEVLRRLGDVDAKPPIRPTLTVSPRCARLIECLPSLEHDPHRPEDVLKVDCDDDGLGGDDAYDAFRYGVMVAANRKVFRVL
jgi:phage terminase large subunit